MRSINGLKASVDIIPINKEFYEISEEERKKNPKKFKNNITINIAQESSFTVVLKMKGGIDNKFFQVFDFGNWPIYLTHLFIVIFLEPVIQRRIVLDLK